MSDRDRELRRQAEAQCKRAQAERDKALAECGRLRRELSELIDTDPARMTVKAWSDKCDRLRAERDEARARAGDK